jgi:hypothetical protein
VSAETVPAVPAAAPATALQRFAPSLLTFLVLVVGGLQAAVSQGPITPLVGAQLAVLSITTFTTWLVPLLDIKWRGGFKTGLELVGVAITVALPFIANGTITPAEALLVAVAVIKAGAAELGVQIRTDPKVVTADPVTQVFNVTTLGEKGNAMIDELTHGVNFAKSQASAAAGQATAASRQAEAAQHGVEQVKAALRGEE